MSTEAQTVVVIQDASRDVGLKAIEKALKKLSVKAGDQLIIVAILNWFSSPSMFSFFGRKSCKNSFTSFFLCRHKDHAHL
jgi:uncharacterized BrkB/YihY/UPF0761 family membrane protein